MFLHVFRSFRVGCKVVCLAEYDSQSTTLRQSRGWLWAARCSGGNVANSVALCDLEGGLGGGGDARAEGGEALVLRLAAHVADVDLGDDDGHAEEA